jgi:methyl-accepting chemotaxis protein
MKLRNVSIRTRLLACTAAMLLALALTSLAAFGGLRFVAGNYAGLAERQYALLTLMADVQHSMGALRRFEKDMLINLDRPEDIEKYFVRWGEQHKKLETSIQAMKAAVSTEEGAQLAAEFEKNIADYVGATLPVLRRVKEGGLDSAVAGNRLLDKAKEPFHNAEKTVATANQKIKEALGVGSQKLSRVADWVGFAILGLLGLALLAGVAGAYVLLRSIIAPLADGVALANRVAAGDLSVQPVVTGRDEVSALMGALASMSESLTRVVGSVRDTSGQIAVASTEVAQGNTDLSERTERAASSLQQTASSVEQLTATVRQTADAAQQANQLASTASSVAARGGEVVAQVVSTMDAIHASSKKISDIIGTIDGIAFQTNILALNAAVEAARAGEQGRGFAVVASEVRSLAQRSADAAREIKNLIGASVEKVESGSRLVGNAGTTMNEIVASVQRVSDIIGEISTAAHEQSAGIGQVNGAVAQLDQMTQQNAALVEQSAAAAESLKEQAARLSNTVNVFKLSPAA